MIVAATSQKAEKKWKWRVNLVGRERKEDTESKEASSLMSDVVERRVIFKQREVDNTVGC